MIATDQLSMLFVEVADTLVDDFDVIDFLNNLVVKTAAVSGSAAAGLMLTDQLGRLELMAASSSDVELLELHQLQYDEGPCIDCYATGKAVFRNDLGNDGASWPRFAPRAAELGYSSVSAFPMRLRSEVIGALNLFGTDSEPMGADDQRIIQALADVATIAILQERNVSRAELLTEQLQGALNSRVVVEQAKGALATLAGVTVDEAFELMRKQARDSRTRLTDVAAAVLAGKVTGLTGT